MCYLPDANAGAQQQADMRFASKMNALKGREALWHSKGAHAITALDKNWRAFTAQRSNIRRQALHVQGRALKAEEGLATKWAANIGEEYDLKTGESGAVGAGRNARLAILRQMAATRATVDNVWREKADAQKYIAKQNYMSNRAKIRSDLGLPPSHYETLNFRPANEPMFNRAFRSFEHSLSIATAVLGLGGHENTFDSQGQISGTQWKIGGGR